MNTVYNLHNAFKRSQLEISSDVLPYRLLRKYPLQKEMLPDNVRFKVATGKTCYDIIRLHERCEEFYSHRFIGVLSQFVDMSDKCYPITIEGSLSVKSDS